MGDGDSPVDIGRSWSQKRGAPQSQLGLPNTYKSNFARNYRIMHVGPQSQGTVGVDAKVILFVSIEGRAR